MKVTDRNSVLISVIIPYYNPETKYFLEAIHSISAQTYSNWEVIIVNDGSNLQSKALLHEYIRSLNDKRFCIVDLEKNCGVSTAKSKGIKHAKGELITFLDPDDFLLPYDLKEIVNVFNEKPECLILSCDYLYYLKFGPIQKICTSNVFNKAPVIFPRLFSKKESFEILKFDPRLRRGEDTDLLIQVLNNNYLFSKLVLRKESGYVYRFYPSKKRLTHNLSLRLVTWEILKSKYKDEKSDLVQYMIKNIENNILEVKYYSPVKAYLTCGSVTQSLKEIVRDYKSIKEKIKCLITLAKVIIEQRFLMPLFSINLQFVDMLVNIKKNYKKVESIGDVNLRKI